MNISSQFFIGKNQIKISKEKTRQIQTNSSNIRVNNVNLSVLPYYCDPISFSARPKVNFHTEESLRLYPEKIKYCIKNINKYLPEEDQVDINTPFDLLEEKINQLTPKIFEVLEEIKKENEIKKDIDIKRIIEMTERRFGIGHKSYQLNEEIFFKLIDIGLGCSKSHYEKLTFNGNNLIRDRLRRKIQQNEKNGEKLSSISEKFVFNRKRVGTYINIFNSCLPDRYKIDATIRSDEKLENIIKNLLPEIIKAIKEIEITNKSDKDLSNILTLLNLRFGINDKKQFYLQKEILGELRKTNKKLSETSFDTLTRKANSLLNQPLKLRLKIDEINICLPDKYKINKNILSEDELKEFVSTNIRPEIERVMQEIKAEYNVGIIKDNNMRVILDIIMLKFGINVEKQLYLQTEIYDKLISTGIKMSKDDFKTLSERSYNLLHTKIGADAPKRLILPKNHLKNCIDNINDCLPSNDRVDRNLSPENFEIFLQHIRPKIIKALEKFSVKDYPYINILRKIIELRFGVGDDLIKSNVKILNKLTKSEYVITEYNFYKLNQAANLLLIKKLDPNFHLDINLFTKLPCIKKGNSTTSKIKN